MSVRLSGLYNRSYSMARVFRVCFVIERYDMRSVAVNEEEKYRTNA